MCETDLGAYLGACLTELIQTWKQDSLTHRSTWYKERNHDPCSAGYKLNSHCGVHPSKHMPWKPCSHPAGDPSCQQARGTVHAAVYAQTLGTGPDISLKPHCWQGSAGFCCNQKMISLEREGDAEMQMQPCMRLADLALHEKSLQSSRPASSRENTSKEEKSNTRMPQNWK